MIILLRFILCVCGLHANIAGAKPSRIEQHSLQPTGHDEPFFDTSFDDMVKATLEEWKVPGLSIAVVDANDIHSKGYGFASLPDQAATPDTQFFAGSTTKAFTAAAVAQLVHNHSHYPDIQWTSPVNRFLRNDFALVDEHATTHTTIEDALSHRSGLAGHDLIFGMPGDTPSSVVQRMEFLPLTADPRTTFQYCNIMYAVITDLLETVTGMTLESLLQAKFWTPLGMTSTTFSLPSTADTSMEDSRLARGYFWDSDRICYVAEPYLDILPVSGAGATISTVNDYALWIKALLSAAHLDNSTNTSSPVTPAMFRDLVTPRTFLPGSDEAFGYATPPAYALGWLNLKSQGESLIFHNGGLPGFGTNLFLLPQQNFGVVTMGNTAETSNDAGMLLALALIRRKLNAGKVSDYKTLELKDAMTTASQVLLPRLTRGRLGQSPDAQQSSTQAIKPATLPLPGSIQDYAGLYTHPAYGTFNLTVITGPSEVDVASSQFLQAYMHRTFRYRLQLRHTTDTVFALEASRPHGIGDMDSNDVVWGASDTGEGWQAVFKFGLDGESVETLGLELVDQMRELARAKGAKAWKEGMIWFERVS